MAKILAALLLCLAATACERAAIDAPPGRGDLDPFPGINRARLSPADRLVIDEASDDFKAILSGKKPVHAVFDKDVPVPADGGTTLYRGRHYRLTATITLASFGSFHGVAFGPRLQFDEAFSPGFNQEISSIRVYSNEQLAAQLHGL